MNRATLILLRHGESEWNSSNRFCGWVDVGLSPLGFKEAEIAGTTLKDSGIEINTAYTSLLTRANQTLDTVLNQIQIQEVYRDWRLNERHYGGLTGLDKAECVLKYGKEQVGVWRRSYDVQPPEMDSKHPFYSQIIQNKKFKGILREEDIPCSESLADLVHRTTPLWRDSILPNLARGKTVLIVAHGTSLRGLVMHIEGLSSEEIEKTDLPNGIPFMYRYNSSLDVVERRVYLADEDHVQQAILKVSNIIR